MIIGYLDPWGKEFKLSYHNKATKLCTIDRYYGN